MSNEVMAAKLELLAGELRATEPDVAPQSMSDAIVNWYQNVQLAAGELFGDILPPGIVVQFEIRDDDWRLAFNLPLVCGRLSFANPPSSAALSAELSSSPASPEPPAPPVASAPEPAPLQSAS